MPTERLPEGTELAGRYEIREIVGRGGMGTVYRARDNRLDTVVAVKEMIERQAPEEEREAAIRQFEREAKLLGQLSHPNLPRVTDYFVEENRGYLIMEFVQGRTLEALMQEQDGRPLPLADVLDWGVQLADVLAYLHGQTPPVVFRDLKPANIMITGDKTIKLIDFGIARRFQTGVTKDTLLYGSPGYSPPEQYGRTQTDPRSDIYALGATLHHLVTGRDPAATPFKFPSIRSYDPNLLPELDNFIGRCVEMDPERRIQTSDEARDALIQIRADAAAAPPPKPKPAAAPAAPATPAPHIISKRLADAERAEMLRRTVGGLIVLLLLGSIIGGIAFMMRSKRPVRVRQAAVIPPPPTHADQIAPPVNPPPGANGAQTGTLRISGAPEGTRIVVDGQEAGATPRDVPNVPAGQHTVQLIPPVSSGLASWTRDVQILAGETLNVEAQMAAANPPSPGPDANAPRADILSVAALPIRRADMAAYRVPRPGVRVSVGFRLSNGAGKSGTVGVFFYGIDQTTPLRPPAEAGEFQNAEGQLSLSRSFHAETDPADFADFPLFIPENAFPVPYDQMTYRVIVFVEGKAVGQSKFYTIPPVVP